MSNPAGWFPQSDGQQRYWDGEQWTDHFAPGAAPAAIPIAKPKRRWFKKKRFVLPLTAVAIIVIVSSLSNGGSSSTSPTSSSAAAPAAAAAAAPAAPAPAPKAPSGADYDAKYGTFAVITKSGHGDTTIKLPAGVKAGLVTATEKGSANFQIGGMDASNQPTIDGLVNEIGNYSGTSAFGLDDMGSPSVKLQVTADGDWSIKIAPISTAPLLPASASGKGAQVFRYDGGAVDVAITHKGAANFLVDQKGGDLMTGVNEIGNYSGTVPFVAGPTVVVIQADGVWTLKQQS